MLMTTGLLIWLSACTGEKKASGPNGPLPAGPPPASDYRERRAWAAHPAFYDLSDSVPAPLKPMVTDTLVDVFFLHPTSYLSKTSIDSSRLAEPGERYRWNADIYDSTINAVTDNGSMLKQASAFNQYRVFAPRYRQAHIQAFYIDPHIAKPLFDTAYADIKKAFLYYLENENQGRPFIIASHSQGTLHAAHLIKELIENTPLAKKLVAAYLLGLPVADTYFTVLKPCGTPGETNCFVSWRTFKKGYEPPYVKKEPFKAVVVNPLSWQVTGEWVSRKENKGAVLYKFNKPLAANVGTQIHGNILWSSKPRFFGNILLTRKNYHIGDINLFWMNIRENVAQRVAEYKKG